MARKVSREKEAKAVELLKKGTSIRETARLAKVSKSKVENLKKELDAVDKDIVATAEILEFTNNHFEDLKNKYDPEKFRIVIKKSVKISTKSEEIKNMLANGTTGLLEANLIGASAYSNKILENISNGVIDSDDIVSMIAINNQAPKVGNEFIEKMKEDVLAELDDTEQLTFDFDDINDENEATNLYLEMIKNT